MPGSPKQNSMFSKADGFTLSMNHPKNPGSKLQTAVTGKVKPGSKAAGRRKSFCARSKGWTGERGKAARARWKC